jgi:hypothetical protein
MVILGFGSRFLGFRVEHANQPLKRLLNSSLGVRRDGIRSAVLDV